MIGKLRGIIDTINTDNLILDVGGVGYIVFCSAQTLRQLPGKGEAATVLIETKIAEDRFDLYGFATEAERGWFKELMKVNGVSSRISIAVLSVLPPQQLATAIAAQDASAFKPVSGVGPKLAARIITELTGKAPVLSTDAFVTTTAPKTGKAAPAPEDNALNDAISALVNLGYSRSDAFNAIHRIAHEEESLAVGDLIRKGLKELSQ